MSQRPYIIIGEEKIPRPASYREIRQEVTNSYKRQRDKLQEQMDDLDSDFRIFWGLYMDDKEA